MGNEWGIDFRFLVRRLAALKDVHIQILRTQEYISFHRKEHFADMVKDLDMRLIWIIKADQYNHVGP